jgi:hypothetical protein
VFDLILDSLWAGPLLWAALYISDYYLTIACARLYRTQDKVVFEGSFEITPLFQADVNALRLVSPRFCLLLIASTGYLFLVRWLAGHSTGYRNLYLAVFGAMFLMEATIHTRHLRNWFLFKRAIPLTQGRLEYPRGIMLRMSAFEIFIFSVLYSALFLVTDSMFLLGGAIACCALAIKHYRLARRHDAAVSKAGKGGPPR